MEVKWNNVIMLALILFALLMLIHMHKEVFAFLGALGRLGPTHPTDEKFWGLAVFGLVCFTLLGVLIALIRNQP